MTARPPVRRSLGEGGGYYVTLKAFVPCDVEDEEARHSMLGQINDWRAASVHMAYCTIIRFAVEMVREDDGGMTLDEIAFLAGNRAPPNPDLDAAAAAGGMGQPLTDLEWAQSEAEVCPVCHTPGGEHAPGCVVCKACMGEGGASQKVGQVVGPWAECGRCAGHGRVMTEESEKDG